MQYNGRGETRILQLEDMYNNHLVQLSDKFRAVINIETLQFPS